MYHKKFHPKHSYLQTQLSLCKRTPCSNIIINDCVGKQANQLPITTAVGLIKTNTLSVWDHVTGTFFLIDIGANVCVFPASPSNKHKHTPTANLTVANGSKINTWKQRIITFILGKGKQYHQRFYLANVACCILGANFFMANNIAIDLCGHQLVNLNHSNIFAVHTEFTSNSHCGLVLGTTRCFNQLWLEFPQTLAPSLQNQVSKHSIEHHIITSGPSVHSQLWHLTAQKLA